MVQFLPAAGGKPFLLAPSVCGPVNGRSAGIWLNPLTTDDGNGLRGFSGEGRPWNPGAITGGRVWGDIPDNSVQPGAGNGEPVTAEVLAQRQAEEAIRRETERRADEIVRKMAENKPDLPDGKTELAVRDIAGQERDRTATSERETALPESVLRESQREREAVREVGGLCPAPVTALPGC